MKIKLANDFSSNRYYNDNPDMFLQLKQLWLSYPKLYTQMLNKKIPSRKREEESYNKHHPMLLWIEEEICKHSNLINIPLQDKVKFILSDQIDYVDNSNDMIYTLYPNTKTDTIELQKLKAVISKNPCNWAWLITNIDKYSELLNFINENNFMHDSTKYTLATKVYWILNNIQQFPVCKNPECSNLLTTKNIYKLFKPKYDYCCKECAAIGKEYFKEHKKNSYFNKVHKYVEHEHQYLQNIFETNDSPYKIEYLNIISNIKCLQLKKYSINDCIKFSYEYNELHHIIPKWYYFYNNIKLDNSIDNTVVVPYHTHIKLHILLLKHFQFIHDHINFKKAFYACIAFLTHIDKRKLICKSHIVDVEQQYIELVTTIKTIKF